MAFEPGIPSASANPFISVSSLPEGTLFIAVGSVMLGLFVIVMLWRLYAIFRAQKAARRNESRFTAMEPSYGGPFVDPVENRQSFVYDGDEKPTPPESHPIGVPLRTNPSTMFTKPGTKPRPVRPKSQVDRMRDAQMQGKFFSPTADVLQHGMLSQPGALAGLASGSSHPTTNSSRLSVLHSGRQSVLQTASLSQSDLSYAEPMSNPSASSSTYPDRRMSQVMPPVGPAEGPTNVPPMPRSKKLRPPSMYLDSLG